MSSIYSINTGLNLELHDKQAGESIDWSCLWKSGSVLSAYRYLELIYIVILFTHL